MKPVLVAWAVVRARGETRESRIGFAYPEAGGKYVVELDAIPRDGKFELRETGSGVRGPGYGFGRTSIEREVERNLNRKALESLQRRGRMSRGSSWLDGLADDPFDYDYVRWEKELNDLNAEWFAPPGARKVEPRSGPWVGPQRPWPRAGAGKRAPGTGRKRRS